MQTDKKYSQSLDMIFENIEKLSRLQQALIAAVALLLLVGGFVYFSYLPKVDQIRKLTGDHARLQKEIVVAQKKAAQLESKRQALRAMEDDYKLAMQQLPDKEEIPSLLASITESGKEAGLEFTLFEPRPEARQDFYAEIPVAINVKGNYHEVGLFFDKVAQLSRIVNITNLEMKQDEKEGNLSTSCTAVTYKFLDKSPQHSKANS